MYQPQVIKKSKKKRKSMNVTNGIFQFKWHIKWIDLSEETAFSFKDKAQLFGVMC